MASTTSKGNYYKVKTKKYLESLGYEVQMTEFVSARPIGGGRMIWTKKDVFSADMIAMNGEEILFVNAKSTTRERVSGISKHSYQGRNEFAKHRFPPCVKRQLYVWIPKEKPIVIDCI